MKRTKLKVMVLLALFLMLNGSNYDQIGTYHEKYCSEENNAAFYDIVGHWAENDIQYLCKNGIIKGIQSDKGLIFKPNFNITRAEFLTVLLKVKVYSVEKNTVKKFSDVFESDWYNDVINTAANKGIINGYSDGTFRPKKNITRAEIAVLIVKSMELTIYIMI